MDDAIALAIICFGGISWLSGARRRVLRSRPAHRALDRGDLRGPPRQPSALGAINDRYPPFGRPQADRHPRHPDGLHRRGRRRCDRLPARQPHLVHLWRNVMPHLEGLGRLVACDLVGMGSSGKLPDSGPAAITSPNSATTFSPCGTPSTSATTWCWSCTTGARRWASTGHQHRDRVAGIASWRASSSPSPGMSSRAGCGRSSRASAPRRRGDGVEHNMFVEAVPPGATRARSPTRRWTTTGRRSPAPAKADGPRLVASQHPDRRRAGRRHGGHF